MAHLDIMEIYSGSKVIGRVKGDTLFKSIKGSVHMLRKPKAIAINLDALESAEQAGAICVQVLEKEAGTIYKATISHIRERGFTFDRGFGPQIALPLAGWSRTRRGQLIVSQPALFEM